MDEIPWEGGRGFYGFQIAACAVVLYSRILFSQRAPSFERAPSMARFHPSFLLFQRTFLGVFFLASVAEGLQGVYWETLYEKYGLKRRDIALLLAIGHGSSLLLGTFFGASADYIGRKRACIMYGIFQALGCLAKQSRNFNMLCFAHVCLGIAGSLYLSAFEAWLTAEHEKMGFKQEWLNDIFWVMAFGNGIVATGSGALATVLVGWQGFTGAAPTMAAAAAAVLCIVAVSRTWGENVGTPHTKLLRLQALLDKRVVLLGWTQACFDFSISVFWFLWIPTLVADGREVHSGLIYTRLIVSTMLGSSFAAFLLCGPLFIRPESFLPYVFIVAGFSLFLPAYDYQEVGVVVACFCVFHVCVGIAWPSLARLRSIYIQNDRRAAVLSVFRVPVHIALLFIIIRGGYQRKLYNSTIFATSILGLLSGAAFLHILDRIKRVSYESFPVERP